MTWLETAALVIGAVAGLLTVLGIIIAKIVNRFEKSVKISVEPMMLDYSKMTNSNMIDIKENLTRQIIDLSMRLDEYKSSCNNTDDKVMRSLMDLSRESINRAYKYYSERGEIDEHTMYCLQRLGESYSGLGGNSFASDEIESLKDLHKTCGTVKKSSDKEKEGVCSESAK